MKWHPMHRTAVGQLFPTVAEALISPLTPRHTLTQEASCQSAGVADHTKDKHIEWRFLDKCLDVQCRAKSGLEPYGTDSPSQPKALRFIDSARSPSTKTDRSTGELRRRRLVNRHGRQRRVSTPTYEGTPIVNTSTAIRPSSRND